MALAVKLEQCQTRSLVLLPEVLLVVLLVLLLRTSSTTDDSLAVLLPLRLAEHGRRVSTSSASGSFTDYY